MPLIEQAALPQAPRAQAWRALVAIPLLAWLGVGLALLLLGSTLRDAVLVSLGLVIQWISGTILWLAIRRGAASLIEAAGVGLVLGSVLAALAGVAGNALLGWAWWWLAPTFVAALVLWRFGSRSGSVPFGGLGGPATWWPVVGGVLVGLGLLWLNLRRYPLSWDGVWDGYHPDMVFFEALGYSVADFGSSDSIFMVGGDIRYHWLTYAWSGQLSSAFDAGPFMVLTRALPLVALVALVLLAVALVDLVARAQSGRSRMWARWLALALVIPGGYVGAVNGTILNFDSPSQALTSAWVLAWTVLVVIVVTAERSSVWLWGALALLAFAITGGKVSAGAVIAVGIGFAAAVGIIARKQWWRPVLIAALVTGVAVGLAGLIFAWGSASPGDLRFLDWNGRASTVQGLNSSTGRRGATLGTAGLLLAMTARWAGGVFLLASRSWRARMEPWLALGFVLAGVLPVVFFAQGVNETWFALTASAPLSVFAAVGVTVGWQRAGLGTRVAVLALLAGVLGFLIVSYIWTDQVWESGFGRFWGPWLGVAIAGAVGAVMALIRRQRAAVTLFAVAALVLTVEAALGRGTPMVAAAVGGARDGAGVRASQLADPGLIGASEVAGADGPADLDVPLGASLPTEASEPAGVDPASEPPDTNRPLHSWSTDQAEAAAFLRTNANSTDVIVTNETDGFLVPALTRMRTYISGVPYQALYGSTETAEAIPERLETNTHFLESGDEAPLRKVCDAGPQWIWLAMDRPGQGDVASFGIVEFENESVTIVRIGGCGS